MVRTEGGKLVQAIVCTPEYEYFRFMGDSIHNLPEQADRYKTLSQHDELKSVLSAAGCEVVDVPELSDHPNSVFTRDTAVCTPEGYIRLRMGLPTRSGEEYWMSRVLDSLGEPCLGVLQEPATAEGGDIMLAGDIAFLGRSRRTNETGIRQLSKFLENMGYEPRVASIPRPYLHLGGAMSMLGADRVLCVENVFPEGFFKGFRTVEIPAGSFVSGNIICVGENEVIAEQANVACIQELKIAGVHVHALELSEFIKGYGGPSCLLMPVKRLD